MPESVGAVTYTFTAVGKPRVKQRPRMTRSGRTYTPQATLEAEALLREQYDGPLFEGPIAVRVEYFGDHQIITIEEIDGWRNESKLRGDLDNYLKVLDGLNKHAWNDDRQIKHLTGVIH